jgi:transposase
MDPHVLCGIDVSAKTLDVALFSVKRGLLETRRFENTALGHQDLVGALSSRAEAGTAIRVCLESTGVYSVDLCSLLHRSPQTELMVVNPRIMSKFREALSERNKTDRGDAQVALEYLKKMEFEIWKAPAPESLELRQMARRIEDLVKLRTQEKNRLHAVGAVKDSPAWLKDDITGAIDELSRRIDSLRARALKLIRAQKELNRCFQLLLTIKGVAESSAILLLSELAILPEGMTVKQWVAWAGLDVAHFESGTSVRKIPTISRKGSAALRKALFLPALSAARFDLHVKAYFQEVLGRTKKPLKAYIAVMRKLLHSIFGMFKNNRPFEGARFRVLAQ